MQVKMCGTKTCDFVTAGTSVLARDLAEGGVGVIIITLTFSLSPASVLN